MIGVLLIKELIEVARNKGCYRITLFCKEELINFYSILEKNLDDTNFFLVKERKKITKQKIRNIFNKLQLTSKDLATLLGVIKSLRKNNQK